MNPEKFSIDTDRYKSLWIGLVENHFLKVSLYNLKSFFGTVIMNQLNKFSSRNITSESCTICYACFKISEYQRKTVLRRIEESWQKQRIFGRSATLCCVKWSLPICRLLFWVMENYFYCEQKLRIPMPGASKQSCKGQHLALHYYV